MQKKELNITPSLRRHLPAFIIDTIFVIILLIGMFLFPESGIKLFKLSNGSWLVFSKIWFLVIVAFFFFSIMFTLVRKVLDTITFKIRMNPLVLEYSHGILLRRVESVDLSVITDFAKKRYLSDQILGLGNVVIHSTDFRTPLVRFDGLRISDAQAIIKFLQDETDSSLVEYFKSKDLGTHKKGIDPRIISAAKNGNLGEE